MVSATSFPTQAAHQTTGSYDSAGELVSATAPATAAAPNGATTSYAHDPAGNKLTSIDPDGITTTWTYTPGDHTATIAHSGSSAHSVSYTYDANANKTAMTDATGSASHIYDPFGVLTSARNGAGQTTGYGYDANGNTTTITYPLPGSATWAATANVTYGYDNASRPASVTDFNNNKITIGNTADAQPNSLALAATGDTITTTYDQTGTPSLISLKNGSTTLASYTYTGVPSGAIASETDTPASPASPASYTYDPQNRVTSMTPGTGSPLNYSYDASAGLTTTPTGATGTYDNAGELTSTVLAGHDHQPHLQRRRAAPGRQAGIRHDRVGDLERRRPAHRVRRQRGQHERRHVRRRRPQGIGHHRGRHPELRLEHQHTRPGPADGLRQRLHLHAGRSTRRAGQPLRRHHPLPRRGRARLGPRHRLGDRGPHRHHLLRHLGQPHTTDGLSTYTPFGFADGYTDPTGLVYLINRYYDLAAGQFLSVDPMVTQTNQPYAYAGGNPVNKTDPAGNNPGCGVRCWTFIFEFQDWLPTFQHVRNSVCWGHLPACNNHNDSSGRTLDWSSDGCSGPVRNLEQSPWGLPF